MCPVQESGGRADRNLEKRRSNSAFRDDHNCRRKWATARRAGDAKPDSDQQCLSLTYCDRTGAIHRLHKGPRARSSWLIALMDEGVRFKANNIEYPVGIAFNQGDYIPVYVGQSPTRTGTAALDTD